MKYGCKIDRLLDDQLSYYVDSIMKEIHFLKQPCCSDIITFNIKLALWEILTNLICHGTSDACTNISILIEEDKQKIIIEVISPGNVFDWSQFIDNQCPSSDQIRGRGIYILTQICDEFSYEEEGRIAKLVFKKEKEI